VFDYPRDSKGGDGGMVGGGGHQQHYHPYLFSDLVPLQNMILLVTLKGMISIAKWHAVVS